MLIFKHSRLLFILGILFFAMHSRAQAPAQNDTLSVVTKKMLGEWDWAETKTLDRGTVAVKNAEVCQCSKKIVFNKNGNMDYYENDVLINSGPYEISLTDDGNFFLKSPVYNDLFVIKKDGVLEIGTMGNGGSVYYYEK
ncbi:MAG: hypothetical protein JST26_11520 [Bacteroidetes bacterium]|nr:hypothetical protein [Bacteroidota bacterium]